jgi:hypothetical protein
MRAQELGLLGAMPRCRLVACQWLVRPLLAPRLAPLVAQGKSARATAPTILHAIAHVTAPAM